MEYKAVTLSGKTLNGIAVAAMLWCCVFGAIADEFGDSRLSQKAQRTAESLRLRIKAEEDKLHNHPWAGDYFQGDGLGVNVSLTLAPQNGFVFEWHGCLGDYDRNFGSVTFTNGRVRLQCTYTNRQEGFRGIAEELIPVRWGERQYLIPSEDLAGFCNQFNTGAEPRPQLHGFYFLRRGDESKKVRGKPAVPGEFQSYLLDRPIGAKIIGILHTAKREGLGDIVFKDTTVRIDVGGKAGLHPGMELFVTNREVIVESVVLTKVADDSAEGIITQSFKDAPVPKVGWGLSTSPPWKDIRKQ